MRLISASLKFLAVLIFETVSLCAGASEINKVKLPAETISTAEVHIREAAEYYKQLQGATVEPNGFSIYRPDVEKIAYYEVLFTLQNGKRGGYLLVSTDTHDMPVAQWALNPASNVERLGNTLSCDFNARKGKVYLLDDITFVAILEDETICGKIGNGIWLRQPTDWKKYKSDYSAELIKRSKSVKQPAAEAWKEARQGLKKIEYCEPWEYHWAGDESQQMLYSQLNPGEAPNNTQCFSGCGATAWAMLFGWADNQAALGNDAWRNSGNIFGDKATPPSRLMSANIKSAIWEIQGDLNTECIGDQGYTLPNNMANAGEFLERRGYSRNDVSVRWDPIVNDSRRDQADDAIRRGVPVVIALGAEHYPLSFGYRKKNCKPLQRDKHEFFINNGQGGDFRWTTSSTWFVGEILTSSRPSSGTGTCSGRGMKSCPNGCWNPSTPPHCVALDYQCPPDLCGGCPDNKRCCEPGWGPHPRCKLCIPKAGPYVCP